ncbi:MAG: tetratricopeptide repeat protein [Myxococcaceae bacterium]
MDREATFKQIIEQFPDSPMGHFSLGRLYLDEKRWADAATCLAEAVRLDPTYAAALVALGDARAGAGDKNAAREAWQKALETPHGRKDMSLQGDLEQRLRDLDDF